MFRPMLSDEARQREVARVAVVHASPSVRTAARDGAAARGRTLGRHRLEIVMEHEPPIAVTTHHRDDPPWAAHVVRAHLDAWRRRAATCAATCGRGEGAEGVDDHEGADHEGADHEVAHDAAAHDAGANEVRRARETVLRTLWPVVLGEQMLDGLDGACGGACGGAGAPPPGLLLEALFAARWGQDVEK